MRLPKFEVKGVFWLGILVFLAAALPEVANSFPEPWARRILGVAAGCVALKALFTDLTKKDEAQDVKVVNGETDAIPTNPQE